MRNLKEGKCFKDGGGGYRLPLVVALVNVKLRMDE